MSEGDSDKALEAKLDEMRRSAGLSLDRECRWVHQGRRIEHERLRRALHQGIGRHPQSQEYIVRIGEQWCYIEVEDTPYLVVAVVPGSEGLTLRLSDGTEEALDPTGLDLQAEERLYVQVKGGAFPARFSRVAFHALMPYIAEREGEPVLSLPSGLFPMRSSG